MSHLVRRIFARTNDLVYSSHHLLLSSSPSSPTGGLLASGQAQGNTCHQERDEETPAPGTGENIQLAQLRAPSRGSEWEKRVCYLVVVVKDS